MAHEWMLDSGFWKLGCRRDGGGVAAARILYSVFCILPAAYACDAYSRERRAGPPGFCILYSVFCRPHMHGRMCT